MRFICHGYCAHDDQLFKLHSLKNLNTAADIIILLYLYYIHTILLRTDVPMIIVGLKLEFYKYYKMRLKNEKTKIKSQINTFIFNLRNFFTCILCY